MPIVFVHGVATRRDPGYAKSEAARAALMRSFLVPAVGQVSFFAPYWGGQAAAFAWEHASLPQGDEEVFGPGEETPAILLGEVWESEPPPDDRVVLQVARNSFADGIDLLFGTAAEDVDPEEAAASATGDAPTTEPAMTTTFPTSPRRAGRGTGKRPADYRRIRRRAGPGHARRRDVHGCWSPSTRRPIWSPSTAAPGARGVPTPPGPPPQSTPQGRLAVHAGRSPKPAPAPPRHTSPAGAPRR
jgi:hypothetical protein